MFTMNSTKVENLKMTNFVARRCFWSFAWSSCSFDVESNYPIKSISLRSAVFHSLDRSAMRETREPTAPTSIVIECCNCEIVDHLLTQSLLLWSDFEFSISSSVECTLERRRFQNNIEEEKLSVGVFNKTEQLRAPMKVSINGLENLGKNLCHTFPCSRQWTMIKLNFKIFNRERLFIRPTHLK